MNETRYTSYFHGEIDVRKKRVWIPARYVTAILVSASLAIVYGHKLQLSIELIAMVNHTAVRSNHTSPVGFETTSVCRNHEASIINETKVMDDGPLVWDELMQGLLVSSFYIGKVFSQIPGGRLAETFSAKWLLIGSIVITTVGTILMPLAAQIHYFFALGVRIAQGFANGFCLPVSQVLLANWSPPTERSVLGSIIHSGVPFGMIITVGLSALLVDHVGWSAMFYIVGSFPIIWCVLAVILLQDSPEEMKIWITREEKDHIARSLRKKLPVPWGQIFRSVPVLAICISHFCSLFAMHVLTTNAPLFLYHILGFGQSQLSGLMLISNCSKWVFCLVVGKVLTILEKKGKITRTAARKIAMLIGSGGPLCCVIGLAFIGCNRIGAVLLLTAATTVEGAGFSGFHVNHVDIAPNFAGTLMGISITWASVAGFIVPIFIGALSRGDRTMAAWRKIFLTTAGIFVIDVFVFLAFGTAEVQPWNDLDKHDDKMLAKLRSEDDSIPVRGENALRENTND